MPKISLSLLSAKLDDETFRWKLIALILAIALLFYGWNARTIAEGMSIEKCKSMFYEDMGMLGNFNISESIDIDQEIPWSP